MQTERSVSGIQQVGPALSRLLGISAPLMVVLITAVLILERTPQREPLVYAMLVGTLLILTWISARSKSDYRLWALYTGGFALFSIVRSFADETGIATHIDDLVVAEKTLAFGAVPTVWLQTQLFDPRHIGWLDRATTYVHWSYFVLPHIFAGYLFLERRHLFERYVLLFVGVLTAGLAICFIFPAAPPWAASLTGHLDPTYKVVTQVGSELNVNLYQYFDSQIRSSNPVAAMPSVHMAISMIVLLIAFRINWLLGGLAVAYNAAMAFSLVYLGEHYVLDILAGALLAVAVYVGMDLWIRLRRHDREPDPVPVPLDAADGPTMTPIPCPPAEPGTPG
jgi:membrane-associated phospholipid phosphatase